MPKDAGYEKRSKNQTPPKIPATTADTSTASMNSLVPVDVLTSRRSP